MDKEAENREKELLKFMFKLMQAHASKDEKLYSDTVWVIVKWLDKEGKSKLAEYALGVSGLGPTFVPM